MSAHANSGIQVRLDGRRIDVVVGAVSETAPGGGLLKRGHGIRSLSRLHKMHRCLVCGEVLYLSDLKGIGLAPQIEANADLAKLRKSAMCLCVPFDDLVYLCHFENGMVSRERVLPPEVARREIEGSAEPVSVARCGALSEKFAPLGEALTIDLDLESASRNTYAFSDVSWYLLRRGMISPPQIGVGVVAASLAAALLFLIPDDAPELVPEPVRNIVSAPKLHVANASAALGELASAAHALMPMVEHLGIRQLNMRNDELRVVGRHKETGDNETLAARFGFQHVSVNRNDDFSWRRRLPQTDAEQAALPPAEMFANLIGQLRYLGADADMDWRSAESAETREYRVSARLGRQLIASLHALASFSERLPMRLLKAEIDYGTDGAPRGAALSLSLRTRK